MRIRSLVAGTAVVGALLAATGCSGGSPTHVALPQWATTPTASAKSTASTASTAQPSPSGTTTTTAAAGPCHGAPAPAHWRHVVWIWLENKPAVDIVGATGAPYETALARHCALATDYHGITHPSLPNYIAATSGSTHGIHDDRSPADHPIAGPSIFSQVGSWGSFEESMPQNCALDSSGDYAVKHNPAAYYTDIRKQCQQDDVPLGTLTSGAFVTALRNKTLPEFSFVTPNMCNDTHNCSVRTGDAWLAQWVQAIITSPSYAAGDTALFVTWDEDDRSHDNRVPLIAVAPSITPGTTVTATTNHYSLLRTTEDLLGVPPLGNAATAPSLGLP